MYVCAARIPIGVCTHRPHAARLPALRPQGNDFYREMGDVFATHTIDNPDRASELIMLRSYGPDVSEVLLGRLVDAFGELRAMSGCTSWTSHCMAFTASPCMPPT